MPPMFVAECDIRKFFDSISHDVVRRRWREIGFDAAAERVLAAYLDVYAAGTLGNGRDARFQWFDLTGPAAVGSADSSGLWYNTVQEVQKTRHLWQP